MEHRDNEAFGGETDESSVGLPEEAPAGHDPGHAPPRHGERKAAHPHREERDRTATGNPRNAGGPPDDDE